MQRRKLWLVAWVLVTVLGGAQNAWSQSWPQRPVRIVVPFAAGGNSDIIARTIAQPLSEAFGQQFFIENRTGAAGVIAAEAVAHSPADGYTLFMATSSQIAILPAMTKLPYDPVKDFAPISIIGTTPYVLAVHAGMPVNTLREFIDHVRARPNQLAYATSGLGSVTHLAMVLFLKRTGLDMIPVAYRGGVAMNDIVAGHIPTYFTNLSAAVPYAAGEGVRLLAVSTEKRAPQIPQVPTFDESGFPGFKILTWNGLMAPAGTPKEIIGRIAGEVARVMHDPKLAERFASNGVDPLGNSPEEFAATIPADIELWAEAVKVAGVAEK
ncbi:MAG: putative tricarboxylic transport rane protein [Alphaproteobacteria bacterium]|nr:putative tricarboxylic transport rane protein [Alphaproteobacteria bacterium]